MISVITGTGRLKENKHIWTTRHFKSLSAWGYNLKECLCCFFSSCPQKTILYNILQWRVNPPPPKGVFLLNSNISAVYFSVFLKSVESEKLILINKKFSLVVLGILIQELRSINSNLACEPGHGHGWSRLPGVGNKSFISWLNRCSNHTSMVVITWHTPLMF